MVDPDLADLFRRSLILSALLSQHDNINSEYIFEYDSFSKADLTAVYLQLWLSEQFVNFGCCRAGDSDLVLVEHGHDGDMI